MSGFDWVIAISIGVIALAFAILVIFLVTALVSLKKTIETANHIGKDVEHKMHAFDPYVRLVSGFGQGLEKKSEVIKEQTHGRESFSQGRRDKTANMFNTSLEVAEWALIGLALWQKMKEKK